MHFLKQARRGYNQTVEIARGISAVTDIPVASNLRAVRGHRTQTLLSLEERVKNTEGIFRLRNPEEIDGKNVLILDDVCTTGTTLATAAITIHNAAPNSAITLLTLGVTF